MQMKSKPFAVFDPILLTVYLARSIWRGTRRMYTRWATMQLLYRIMIFHPLSELVFELPQNASCMSIRKYLE